MPWKILQVFLRYRYEDWFIAASTVSGQKEWLARQAKAAIACLSMRRIWTEQLVGVIGQSTTNTTILQRKCYRESVNTHSQWGKALLYRAAYIPRQIGHTAAKPSNNALREMSRESGCLPTRRFSLELKITICYFARTKKRHSFTKTPVSMAMKHCRV